MLDASLVVTDISHTNGNSDTVTSSTTHSNGTTIVGTYGTLTIGADGSYTILPIKTQLTVLPVVLVKQMSSLIQFLMVMVELIPLLLQLQLMDLTTRWLLLRIQVQLMLAARFPRALKVQV